MIHSACFFSNVSVDIVRYGPDNVASPLCGRKAQITNTDNGKSVTITLADACPTCGGGNDWDLSKGAFDAIANEATGIVPSTIFPRNLNNISDIHPSFLEIRQLNS